MKKQPNKLLEKDVQRAVCSWLDNHNFFFWRSNNIPVFGMNNGGKMTFRALPKYTPRGLPDIIVIVEGKFIGLEIKRPGAGLKKEQIAFAHKVFMNGGMYYVIHDISELLNVPDFVTTRPSKEKFIEEAKSVIDSINEQKTTTDTQAL